MPRGDFDIYQTATGVTAVTNAVQRHILKALTEGEKQLPELMEITGKAKPTLSGIHMKELLNRELITEHPHPSDSRRKVYRLNARPLGSSGVPVDELREAVQAYARTAVVGPGIPLDAVVRVLAEAPPDTPQETLRAQGHALGKVCTPMVQGDGPRGFAMALSQFVEKEDLAQHLQIDFEGLSFRCRPGPGVAEVPTARLGAILAGFADGAAEGNGLEGVSFVSKDEGDAFHLQSKG